jgi:hypothetical protein
MESDRAAFHVIVVARSYITYINGAIFMPHIWYTLTTNGNDWWPFPPAAEAAVMATL